MSNSNYKKWFKEILNDINYLGKDLAREAWDHQQEKIDELEIENEKLKREKNSNGQNKNSLPSSLGIR